jgi:hypothetical protein
MGNSAVAVLHFDMYDEIRKISPRTADAMLSISAGNDANDFGFGRIVSWDHANGYQVCVIHGNTGWAVRSYSTLPPDVEKAVAEALKSRGWKCTPPSKR